ncbi:MAG: cysteine synthase family protein [Actinomycetia bacterium]|nr:cysteine synthase family protein [Actinomycetes bacterium]
MTRYADTQALIGETPLVRLANSGFPAVTQVYAKLELNNPSGSVKDRTGKYMIADAERRGLLKPGGTIVEATAGNTGLGIAFAALNKGYRLIFVVPTRFSEEKQTLLHAMGGEIVNTPPEGGMLAAGLKAEEIRASIDGAVSLEQFKNPNNPRAHYETTGPEIWRDTEGHIDYLVAGAGSGGTYSGVLRYLKEQNPNISGVLADPVGSTMGGGEHAEYQIEGIGNDFIAETMNMDLVDKVIKVSDSEAIVQVKRLAAQEGIIAGTSSGAALAAVHKLVRMLIDDGQLARMSSGVAIVTIFPDRGDRYFSKHIFI